MIDLLSYHLTRLNILVSFITSLREEFLGWVLVSLNFSLEINSSRLMLFLILPMLLLDMLLMLMRLWLLLLRHGKHLRLLVHHQVVDRARLELLL